MKNNHKYIYSFYKSNKRMPSYTELAEIYNFKSKNAAYTLATKFIKEGLLKKDNKGKLIPGSHFNKIPLLGSVQAGFPSVGEELRDETLSLDEWLINDHDATYLLRVSGDSMIDAGIIEGDYIVVERNSNANIGDIVIAEVDSEWTMKYLRKKKSKFYLEAANDKYPDIYPSGDLNIQAVVRSLVRRYESKKK